MPVIATEARRFSNVVKKELWPEDGYTREVVIVNEAAARSYVYGTVLGRVTAGGKYRICVQNAADGSQVPAAIVLDEVAIPATTDVRVLVLVRGPAVVSKTGLVFDASFDLQAERDAAFVALEARGIAVNDGI